MPRKSNETTVEIATFPDRLAEAMLRRGVHGRKLSQMSKVSDSLISRYKKKQKFEGVEGNVLVKLARSLRVPVGWLAAGEGVPPWASGEGSLPAFVVQGETAGRELWRGELTHAVDLGTTKVDISGHRKDQHQGVSAGATPKNARPIPVRKMK